MCVLINKDCCNSQMSYWYTCHMHECLIDTLLKTFSLQIMKSVNLSIFGKLQIYQYFTIWCLMKCCLPWKSATWMTLIFEKTLFPCSSRQMLIFNNLRIKEETHSYSAVHLLSLTRLLADVCLIDVFSYSLNSNSLLLC